MLLLNFASSVIAYEITCEIAAGRKTPAFL